MFEVFVYTARLCMQCLSSVQLFRVLRRRIISATREVFLNKHRRSYPHVSYNKESANVTLTETHDKLTPSQNLAPVQNLLQVEKNKTNSFIVRLNFKLQRLT